MTTIKSSTTATTAYSVDADTTGALVIQTGAAPTTAVTVDASQNVTLAGTLTTTGVTTVQAGTAAAPAITTTGDLNTGIFFPAADTIAFAEGGAEVARFDSSGNLGIGTTSPLTKLEVSSATGSATPTPTEVRIATATGAASDWSTTLPWGRLSFYNPDASDAGPKIQGSIDAISDTAAGGRMSMVFNTSAPTTGTLTERMRIDSAGIISSVSTYNNTTASGANAVFQSNGGFQRSTSALKYKQDIRNLESIDITQFRPVRYKSKCDGDDQTKDHFGIIADEVDEAGITELVTYNADGKIEGFQYERLTVVLLKSIQELKAINDTQASTITALTARITALENK
jgi:hypothetical protein